MNRSPRRQRPRPTASTHAPNGVGKGQATRAGRSVPGIGLGRGHAGQPGRACEAGARAPRSPSGVDLGVGVEQQQVGLGMETAGHPGVDPAGEPQVGPRVVVGGAVALGATSCTDGSEELSTTMTGNCPSRAARQPSRSSGAPKATIRTSMRPRSAPVRSRAEPRAARARRVTGCSV